MIIYLIHGHKGISVDDRSSVLVTVPETNGVLTIGGVEVGIAGAETAIPAYEDTLAGTGFYEGEFISTSGIRYTLVRMRLNTSGIPISIIDERQYILGMLVDLSTLQGEVEEIREAIANLHGELARDALGYLGTGGNEDAEDAEAETAEANGATAEAGAGA